MFVASLYERDNNHDDYSEDAIDENHDYKCSEDGDDEKNNDECDDDDKKGGVGLHCLRLVLQAWTHRIRASPFFCPLRPALGAPCSSTWAVELHCLRALLQP